MAEPQLAFTRLAGEPGRGGLLVVGPSLGTSVDALWGQAARVLAEEWEVLGWDLPGHGLGAPATEPFTIGELARVVRRVAAHARGDNDRHVSYAGVSLGGTVGLELALEPGVFESVACIASAAQIGEPDGWRERASLVRAAGTPVLVSGSTERWFAPGFLERDPSTASGLLHALSEADDESYALACQALAAFDLRPRLGDSVLAPLIAPGEYDSVVTPDLAAQTASAIAGARLHVMIGCAHQPPAEDPAGMASVLRDTIEEASRV